MPLKSEPQLTLAVVHWNRPAECAATVRLFLAQEGKLHVVIVDNDSELSAYETLRAELGENADFVRLPENKGWGGALNVVLKSWLDSETTEWCAISAHDAVPQENCLSLLLAAGAADPRAGVVCPQYPDGVVPHLSALRGVFYSAGAARSEGVAQRVDVPHGTLMLVRRSCLSEIGLFDERYFAYGDEHELGARARRRGWHVLMVWGAVVTNPGTWTPSALRSYLFARNSLLLVRDYFGRLSGFLRAALILANTVRLLFTSPRQEFAFSSNARLAAVRDYFQGRYGRPRDR